jgi:hypothetical protein
MIRINEGSDTATHQKYLRNVKCLLQYRLLVCCGLRQEDFAGVATILLRLRSTCLDFVVLLYPSALAGLRMGPMTLCWL